MLGAVIGDIIGSRFEFAEHKSVDFPLFDPACRYTDDSVLTLATASSLLADQPFDTSYRSFYADYPEAGYGARFQNWAAESGAGAYESFGNGSAMRVAPVAWVADSEKVVLALATKSAQVTHNHPEGIRAARAVSLAIFLARRGATREQIRQRLQDDFAYDLQRRIEDVRPNYRFEVSAQRSVPEAILCFLESYDFESALRLAISLGGDADTQAAIAGSLAEAFYGEPPADLLQFALQRLDPFLRRICHDFAARYLPYRLPVSRFS